MAWDWILVGFSSGWTAVTPVDGRWRSACVLPLEVRQGAWTALIRRGRLVRSQLQRRRKAQTGGPLPPSVGSSRRVDPVQAVLGHTIVWFPPCLEMALCRVRGSNPWREETALVARRSWRGALDCKSSASAEWVRIPPPPRRLDRSLDHGGWSGRSWIRGRVVDGARLESVWTGRSRRFESYRIRRLGRGCLALDSPLERWTAPSAWLMPL